MKQIALAAVLLVLTNTSVGHCQDEKIVEAAVAQPAMGFVAGPQNMAAVKRFQLNQIFSVEIEEITRVCELDEGQITKLTVGAKGAVKKLTAEWSKTSGQQFGVVEQARVMNAQGDDDAEGKNQTGNNPEAEITDAEQIDDSTMQLVLMGDMGNPFKANQPTEHEFWQKTLASVLTEAQAAKLGRYQSDRDAAKRKAIISVCMETLKLELGLTADQQTQLNDLVTPLLEKAEIKCFAFFELYMVYYHVSKVEEQSLAALLSPAQLQKWKIFLAPAKQIGQMMEIEARAAAANVRDLKIDIDDD